MRKIASLAALLTLFGNALADDIQLRFVRPSKVLTMLIAGETAPPVTSSDQKVVVGRVEGSGKGIIPSGVTVAAFDSRGILQVDGPKEAVDRIKKFVALCDVEPTKINAELEFNCPLLSASSTTSTALVNNKPWAVEDGSTDVKLGISFRQNDDNTLTITLLAQRGAQSQDFTVRVKPTDIVMLRFANEISVQVKKSESDKVNWKNVGFEEEVNELDDPEAIVTIRLKPTDSMAKKVNPRSTKG